MTDPDPLRRLGDVAEHTREVAAEILAHLEERGTPLPDHPETGDPVLWGIGDSSEHATGYALDLMTVRYPSEVGEAIAAWAWANRDRIGLRHIIYEQTIRSTRTAPGEVRKMSDRGSLTENHYDHVHLFLPDPPALESPAASPGTQSNRPNPTPPKERTLDVDLVNLRDATAANLIKGAGVKPLQRLLAVTADGLGGPRTRDALGDAQQAAGVVRDYVFGPKSAEAFLSGKGKIG